MYNPRKGITISELTEALRKRKKVGLSKFNNNQPNIRLKNAMEDS